VINGRQRLRYPLSADAMQLGPGSRPRSLLWRHFALCRSRPFVLARGNIRYRRETSSGLACLSGEPVSSGFSRCSGERTATPRARYSELLVSVVAFRKWCLRWDAARAHLGYAGLTQAPGVLRVDPRAFSVSDRDLFAWGVPRPSPVADANTDIDTPRRRRRSFLPLGDNGVGGIGRLGSEQC